MKTERVEWEVQRFGNGRWVQYFVTCQEDDALGNLRVAESKSSMPVRLLKRTIIEEVVE